MSNKILRKIVQIDEDKCNGCGQCIPSCHEGAIAIVDGKARLVSDVYCDGLGNCLGECPQDAITIVEREAAAFDEQLVKQRQAETQQTDSSHASLPKGFSCPSAKSFSFEPTAAKVKADAKHVPDSQLAHWPVQLRLVPPTAPYFDNAELLIAADCVPFACADFHSELLAGKSVVICCPKLDNAEINLTKLTEIFATAQIKAITVSYMEVPCCYGLVMLVQQALAAAGKDIPVELVKIGIRGDAKTETAETIV
jgi:Pyruvate/2-oxoacid:ferredoxin oxidoreductase delta subunit